MNEDRPVLDQVNMVVGNMSASVEFYRRLGIPIKSGDPEWDRHHRTLPVEGGLDLDLDSSAFAQKWCREWTPGRRAPVIGFRFPTREAVDRTFADLTGAGYRGLQTPYDAFWGARYAVVEDPDGNPVGLMSPRDPSRQTAPPDPRAIA